MGCKLRAMKLSDYLKAKGITQADFATAIGMSVASVSRIASGLQRPDLDTLLAIKRASGNAVRDEDFERVPPTSGEAA